MLCFTTHSDSDGCRGSSCPWRHIPAAGVCSLTPARPLGTCWPSLTSPGVTAPGRLSQAGTRATLRTDLTPKSPDPAWCHPRISLCLPPPHSISPGIYPKFPSLWFTPMTYFLLFPPLSQPFAHLEPSDVFSLSLAFLRQNPPTFLTLSPSLVYPAQLPRAEPSRGSEPAQPFPAAPWVPLPPAAALFLLCCTFPPLLQQVPLSALTLSHLSPWGWHSDLPAHTARSPWSFSSSQFFRNALVWLTCCLSFPICTARQHGCWWGKGQVGHLCGSSQPKLLPFRGAPIPGLPKAHP